jgi:hypothetical protein
MLQDLVNEDTRGPGFPASYKYDGLLRELAALLVPHILEHVDVQRLFAGASQLVTRETVEEIVQAKMDELGPIDKDMIREVCEEVVDASDIDDKINDWYVNNFDISDYESEIKDMVDVDDAVETHLNTYLHDEVVSCIQGLKFNVEVSSR